MAEAGCQVGKAAVEYLYHHVFLPPKLPQKDDYDSELDSALLHVAVEALAGHDGHEGYAAAVDMLKNMQKVHDSGCVMEDELRKALSNLPENGVAIPLCIRAQNAGLLITKVEDNIHFDVFELSAKNAAIMSTKGRLRRVFPGASVAIALNDFEQTEFQEAIAYTLSNMSTQPVAGMQPQARKAGSYHDEDRDTTHPGMVSELFMGFLRSIGMAVVPRAISKNTRDEILWDHARSPWRRSATWLLIRVALQLTLDKQPAYKEAILLIIGQVLKLALDHGFPSCTIHAMNAKISQRLLKFGSTLGDSVFRQVEETLSRASDTLSQRWLNIEKEDVRQPNLSRLAGLNFKDDTFVSLPELDEYIRSFQARSSVLSLTSFVPSSSVMVLSPNRLPTLPQEFEDKSVAIANLQSFEIWVAAHGAQYSQAFGGDAGTICSDFCTLMKNYHSLAKRYYSDNPEGLSTMVLIVFQLWLVCDSAAIKACPLLDQYDCGMRTDVLENLLLPFKCQMNGLRNVEQHIASRLSTSRYTCNNLYGHLESGSCFAARYFDTDQDLQRVLREIKAWANEKREAKLAELRRQKDEYSRLMETYNNSNCEYTEVVVDHINDFREMRHKKKCKRCRAKNQANGLQIAVDEWPLPKSKVKSKAIVFELRVPKFFSSWREATFYVLMEVLQSRYSSHSSARAFYSLFQDHQLRDFSHEVSQRVGLLSQDKPHVGTHRKTFNVSTATESALCVANGLNYQYFDASLKLFVGPLSYTEVVPRSCTYHLPSRSQNLQKFLFRPASLPDGQTPNDVIATQSACPSHMSLEEGRDLSGIPVGHQIQWHNLLLQLAAPTVDFKKDETAMFVYQCIYQSGPRNSNILRPAHECLDEEHFARALLENLKMSLERSRENWESAQAVGVLSAITCRLLDLSFSAYVQQRCLQLLRDFQEVSFAWVQRLYSRTQETISADERIQYQSNNVEIALICALCFDVDYAYLEELFESPESSSIFIQCAIIIREGKRTYESEKQPILALLDLRFRKLMHRASSLIATNQAALNVAIHQTWSSYRPCQLWKAVSKRSDQWLATETASDRSTETLSVHFNTLTGELLVNGVPLARPPEVYERHALWPILFGRSALEVMPTTAPGMQLSAKKTYLGFDVQFTLNEAGGNTDLLVRACSGASVYETMPSRLLRSEFPDVFIDDFVHWFDHADQTLTFCPVSHPWNFSSHSVWKLSRRSPGSKWQLVKNGTAVAGLRSRTAQSIGQVLSPLADSSSMQVILQSAERSVQIELPNVRLNFHLASDQSSLYSKDFPGMSVDKDQSLGTMIGFANKLILRSHDDYTGLSPSRLLLLPEGAVSYKATDAHVQVNVDRASIIKVHPLRIDTRLGGLVDNGDLQCKLFVAYLHALTAFCLPDALTHVTGTEQSLSILASAAVKSIDQLNPSNIDLLEKLAFLTPARRFYPANERVMQTISFDSQLSFYSQHNELHTVVLAIFDQVKRSEQFYPDSVCTLPELSRVDVHLHGRDRIRSSTFRVSEFGAEAYSSSQDVAYQARDVDQESTRGARAYLVSNFVYHDDDSIFMDRPIPRQYLWNKLCDAGQVSGANAKISKSTIRYDPEHVATCFDYSQWLPLHKLLASPLPHRLSKFDVMLWLSALGASSAADLTTLQVLALLYASATVGGASIPAVGICQPGEGHQVTRQKIERMVRKHCVSLQTSPLANLRKNENEDRRSFESRREKLFSDRQSEIIAYVTTTFYSQWPAATVNALALPDHLQDYIRADSAVSEAQTNFSMWDRNKRLSEYTADIEQRISGLDLKAMPIPEWPSIPLASIVAANVRRHIHTNDLFSDAVSTSPCFPGSLEQIICDKNYEVRSTHLSSLLENLKRCSNESKYEASYIDALTVSMSSLDLNNHETYVTSTKDHILVYQRSCNAHLEEIYQKIIATLTTAPVASSCIMEILNRTKMFPRISPKLLLQQLNHQRLPRLHLAWRKTIVDYGLAITAVQRAERLLLATKSNPETLSGELRNVGHEGWIPGDHPEWLLQEVECNILIRPVQREIASEMIEPPSSNNSMMQLNMGEGKSSVIVPMVASALADSTQLVRVVVAKPQSKQMKEMLVSKLGGLCDRAVRQMPFSRALKLSAAEADTIHKLVNEWMSNGDILLVQPEHILSFKLMGLECFNTAGKEDVGQSIVRVQDFFDASSRDIVDESDENFSPKFEVIYTMGTQRPIQMSPDRWLCIQQVLELVRTFSARIVTDFPGLLEHRDYHKGGFPRIRTLHPDAGDHLLTQVAEHICKTGLVGFPIARQPKNVRDAVYDYITRKDLSEVEIENVENAGVDSFWAESTKGVLLLLRGLIAGGVLAFAFGQKRWRVNYGLVTTRTPPTKLAVPYRAKDNPSPRSEFSHPDVVIILTSLSYYEAGLTNDDLFTAFEHLVRSDQADIEYGQWMKDAAGMPSAFRQLEGVNLRDRPQCRLAVFPHLRFGKSVVDYFLSHVVFPKEMKEFPKKLSASGWDIGKTKAKPTTGFSGTNDSRSLLPLEVTHLDLPKQTHTNALVLYHLLEPQNNVVLMPHQRTTRVSDAEHLLETVIHERPPIQVILDVGAQILELNNLQVAKRWLEEHPSTEIEAVVFVNDEDELSVVDRKGSVEALQISPYSGRLEACLVFLDEAHTRGIDLKLPHYYRAAVTLGANLTKDRLVQACMRMRELGRGQTVAFFIPNEIEGKIRRHTRKQEDEAIKVSDVLLWTISETFIETRRLMPLWAAQGRRFLNQRTLWSEVHSKGVTQMSDRQAKKFLEEEAQTIEHRYRPRFSACYILSEMRADSDHSLIAARCQEFDSLRFDLSALQEEQERELSPEIEQERQVQRPASAKPIKHQVHPDVETFISFGVILANPKGYFPAFEALRDTSAAKSLNVYQFAGADKLFVTADFAATVQKSGVKSYISDSYQRPVQWLLTWRSLGSNTVAYLMVISPFEAQQLLPQIRGAKNVSLHLYKPRCSLSHPVFDKLDFLTIPSETRPLDIPRALAIQLDLFAGQLYLNSYSDYMEVCAFLGLATNTPKGAEKIAPDGFILQDRHGVAISRSSPVPFLRVLMSGVRRNGQGIGKTHLGKLLDGQLLTRSDFEDS